MRSRFVWLMFTATFVSFIESFAAPLSEGTSATTMPTATRKQVGIVLGLNDPVPALYGIAGAVNVLDFLRVTAGIGKFTSRFEVQGISMQAASTTYGVGFRLMLPGVTLTPVLGASWAVIATEGFPNNDHHVYVVAGLEWQTRFGLNLAAGYEQSTDGRIGGLPYVTAGWYFGVL